jgi:hypothetical protein
MGKHTDMPTGGVVHMKHEWTNGKGGTVMRQPFTFGRINANGGLRSRGIFVREAGKCQSGAYAFIKRVKRASVLPSSPANLRANTFNSIT